MLPDPDQFFNVLDNQDDKISEQLMRAQQAVDQARQNDHGHLPPALITYSTLLRFDGQYDSARKAANEVLLIEQRTQFSVEALITLGICAAQSNQLDEAERFFYQAAELSRRINYPLGIARALQYLARMVLYVHGQFQLSLTLMDEVKALREEIDSKHWGDPFLRSMIYQITGDRRHSRQELDDMVLQVEPGTRLATAYYFLWARLAMDEEDLQQAKEYLRLGLRVANRIAAPDLNLLIRLEFSRYHRLQNEAAVARSWADDALHYAQHYGWLFHMGLAYIERAQANWLSGDTSQAEADLADAYHLLEPLQAAYELTRVLFLRALWFRQSQHPQAEQAWLEAAACITRNGYAFILEKEQDLTFPFIAEHMRSKTPGVRQTTETLLKHLANVPPPALRISSLGQFAVWKGRRRIPDHAWTRRKAGELLRYLLLQRNRAAGRDVIIEALWPDHPSDNPADLLHQATSALRHALESDLPDKFPSRYLKVEGEQIALVLPEGSVVDFEHFEQELPMAIQTRNTDRLQGALNLYSGELFPSDQYADWSAEKRQALAELRQRGLMALAGAWLDQGQFYPAINCCQQVLYADSWNEDAVLLAMQAYVGLRNVPHALHLYQGLAKTLKEELGILPRADIRTLAETLRKA